MTSVIVILILWIMYKAAGGYNSNIHIPPYLGGKDENGKWRK